MVLEMDQEDIESKALEIIVDKVDPLFSVAMDKFYIDDEREEYFSGFTHEEQITTLVAMTTVIPYDGIHGWIQRNSGMLFSETCDALAEIRANEYYTIFKGFGQFLDRIKQPRSADADHLVLNKYLESDIDLFSEQFCEALEDTSRSLYVIFLNWYCRLDVKPFAEEVAIEC